MADNLYSSAKISIEAGSRDIRVLTVVPASLAENSTKIYCTLSKASLNENPRYNALSYVWGSTRNAQTISVNGFQLEVTENLHSALARIRDDKHPQVFWVDAICIDQTSNDERAAQVKLMGDIYAQAQEVWSWLGHAPGNEDEALATLDAKGLLAAAEKLGEWGDETFGPLRAFLSPQAAEAFAALAQAPYWTRTWVVQEVVLARELWLLWGTAKLSGSILQLLSQLTFRAWYSPSVSVIAKEESYYLVEMLTKSSRMGGFLWAMTNTGPHLHKDGPLRVLHEGRHQKASDLRDKVYGFLGLLQNHGVIKEVTYEQSVEQIFIDVIRYQILEERSLEPLRFAGLSRGSSTKLAVPSWVADWSVDPDYAGAENWAKPMRAELYNASGDAVGRVKFEENSLLTLGASEHNVSSLLSWGAFCIWQFQAAPFGYPTGIPQLQAVFRVVVMDHYWESDFRMSDDEDPDEYIVSMIVGFFTWLGTVAQSAKDPFVAASSSSIQAELESQNVARAITSPPSTATNPKEHLFVRAIIEWYRFSLEWLEKLLRFLDLESDKHLEEDPHVRYLVENFARTIYTKLGDELELGVPQVIGDDPQVQFLRAANATRLGNKPSNLSASDYLPLAKIRLKEMNGHKDNQFSHRISLISDAPRLSDMFDRPTLHKWKDCLQQAAAGDKFSEILKPFFGGEHDQRLEMLPLGIERGILSNFEQSMIRWTAEMQLFSTSKGLLGLGPKGIRSDDQICVLFGSRVPYVLRKAVDRDHFTLVGECFVLGLMDGEAAERVENGFPTTIFEIQ